MLLDLLLGSLRVRSVTHVRSIPQQDRDKQQQAISSIPAYVDLTSFMLCLTPSVHHMDTGLLCDRSTYDERGWCR